MFVCLELGVCFEVEDLSGRDLLGLYGTFNFCCYPWAINHDHRCSTNRAAWFVWVLECMSMMMSFHEYVRDEAKNRQKRFEIRREVMGAAAPLADASQEGRFGHVMYATVSTWEAIKLRCWIGVWT